MFSKGIKGRCLTERENRAKAPKRCSPGSLIFVFSDFYGVNKTSHRLVSTLSQHNDVVACHVCDPLELEPPQSGRYRVSDGSSAGNFALIDRCVRV